MQLLIFIAVLPAIILLYLVYKLDTVEKEPPGLLVRLFLLGGLTIVSAIIIGTLADGFVSELLPKESVIYILIDNFLMVALVEEGGKYVVLKHSTWRNQAFDYTFDAVVYAVTVSLGFAAFENILYLMDFNLGTAILRGVLAVPGHAIDAIFMGCYYGMAKQCDAAGDNAGRQRNLRLALLLPVLLHGFYDFCLSMQQEFFLLVFLAFEVIVTVTAVRRIRRLSREDAPIGPN